MKIIFGSGIVGLLARLILGPSWVVVPFYRSRFFSFNPALDDNFIIRSDEIDPFISELTKIRPMEFPYKRAWSVQGHLTQQWDVDLCSDWLYKLFGTNIPSQSEPYLKNRMTLPVYDLRSNEIYSMLLGHYIDMLKEESAKGSVTEIGDHYYVQGGVRKEFDAAINTIPLDGLLNLMNINNISLPAKDLHYLHVSTTDLDFEGANQTLVVDQMFSFFKVTNIAENRYLFYCHEDIPNPGAYLMPIIQKFDIIDGTSIERALPMGPIPNQSFLEDFGIYSVGSYAQWDWCMDVGSCILRLIRYANRGNKPATLHSGLPSKK
jgi:hypothetical protein